MVFFFRQSSRAPLALSQRYQPCLATPAVRPCALTPCISPPPVLDALQTGGNAGALLRTQVEMIRERGGATWLSLFNQLRPPASQVPIVSHPARMSLPHLTVSHLPSSPAVCPFCAYCLFHPEQRTPEKRADNRSVMK